MYIHHPLNIPQVAKDNAYRPLTPIPDPPKAVRYRALKYTYTITYRNATPIQQRFIYKPIRKSHIPVKNR